MTDERMITHTAILVVSQNRIERMTLRAGKLEKGERAIEIAVAVPAAWFEEHSMKVQILIPPEAVSDRTFNGLALPHPSKVG